MCTHSVMELYKLLACDRGSIPRGCTMDSWKGQNKSRKRFFLLFAGPWTNFDWCWVTSFVELATTLATTFSSRIRFGNKSDTYWLPSWALNGFSG